MEREPRLVKAARGESGGAGAVRPKRHQRKGVSANYSGYRFTTKSGELCPQVMLHNAETMKNKLYQYNLLGFFFFYRDGGKPKHNYASFEFQLLKANIVI